MGVSNINVRVDAEIKNAAEAIFAELGISMSTAVNVFLRATIREHGLPFELKLDSPSDITYAAIGEGRRLAEDSNVEGYRSMSELKASLLGD